MAKGKVAGTVRQLKVAERFALLTVLPEKGDFLDMRKINELRDELNLTAEEITKFEAKSNKDGVTWNAKKDRGVNFTFGERATDIIVTALKALNESRQLEGRHVTLYEMFVENK